VVENLSPSVAGNGVIGAGGQEEGVMMRAVRTLIAVAIVVGAVAGSSLVAARTASVTEQNKEVVRRHLELMNRGDWQQAAALFAPDVRHHLGNWQQGDERVVQVRRR
jgi:hypothetical protein